MPTVKVTDHAHFARVAVAKSAEHEERLRDGLGRPALAGLRGARDRRGRGDRLETVMALDRRALGQAELAMRGRRPGRRVDGEER